MTTIGYHNECGEWHKYGQCVAEIVKERMTRINGAQQDSVRFRSKTHEELKIDTQKTVSATDIKLAEEMIKNVSKNCAEPSWYHASRDRTFITFVIVACICVFAGAALADVRLLVLSFLFFVLSIAAIRRVYKKMSDTWDRMIAKKRQLELLRSWLLAEEPMNRGDVSDGKRSKYPLDWEMRRCFIISRDGSACRYCRDRRSSERHYYLSNYDAYKNRGKKHDYTQNKQLHHIRPLSKGGMHNLDNLVLLCNMCHEDQHIHLLKKRQRMLAKKLKFARVNAPFWQKRLSEVQNRIHSLETQGER